MDDDPMMQAIWRRLQEPTEHEQLEAARIETQTAQEEIKTWKLKTWEKHKEAASLKNEVKLADGLAEELRLELSDANEEICSRNSRVEALEIELEDMMKISRESDEATKLAREAAETLRLELSDAKEEICFLGSRAEAREAEFGKITKATEKSVEQRKLADEAAETLRLELSDANEEISVLESRAAAREVELEHEMNVAKKNGEKTKLANDANGVLLLELSEANEHICSLESRARSQEAEVRDQMSVARENGEKTKLANDAAEMLRLALGEANEEISNLKSRSEALKAETETEMKVARDEIEEARETIATLQWRIEALTTEVAEFKERIMEAQGLDQTDVTIRPITEQAKALADKVSAARQSPLSGKTSTHEPNSMDGAAFSQCQSHIELLKTQLQLRDEHVEDLQRQLQEEKPEETVKELQRELQAEKRDYENLKRSTKKQMLEARSVSADLLHAYLRNDKEGLKEPKQPTIKLRDHDWVLSLVEEPPREPSELDEPARVDNERPFVDTPGSPIPDASDTGDHHSIICEAPATEFPATAQAQDPRTFSHRSRERLCVCSRCHKQKLFCTSGVQCGPCTEAGERCTYKHCYSGEQCRFPRCGFVHPGQEVVDGYERHMEGGRYGPKRRRLE